MQKLEVIDERSPRDILTRAAAREFQLSAAKGERTHRREYDRMAFLAIAFLLSNTQYDPGEPDKDIIAGKRYAQAQYEEATGQPLPIQTDIQGWATLKRLAASSFSPAYSFRTASDTAIAQAILDQNHFLIAWSPILADHDHLQVSGGAA